MLPLDLREQALLYRLDLKIACTTMEAFQEHISKSFARLFNVQTDTTRPIVVLSDLERRAASLFAQRPFIVFSSHSVSNPDRPDGHGKRKDWPHERWQELAPIASASSARSTSIRWAPNATRRRRSTA